MLLWLIIGVISLIVYAIRSYIWNKTREKLENESEKYDFLHVKFSRLIESEISPGVEFDDIDAPLLLVEMSKNKQKKAS